MANRSTIYHWIYKERCRNEKVEDHTEQQKRNDLLDKILEAANEYEAHLFEHGKTLKFLKMIERGIQFEEGKHSSKELKKKWSTAFASDLTKETKARIHFKDYLWHAFSFEELHALEREYARRAFNRTTKTGVYIFYQHKEKTYHVNDARHLKSSDFDMDIDVYIMDSNMKWTYVHTHERGCGPYFFRKE